MTAKELIYKARFTDNIMLDLVGYFAFEPLSNNDKVYDDKNLPFRTEIVECLLLDFSLQDSFLIREIFNEELKCELAIGRHDNLYQLCYYLFSLGNLDDVFLIYNAKFNSKNMDTATVLDWEMLYMSHPVNDVIQYVEYKFADNPKLKEKYPAILEKLNELKNDDNFSDLEDYSKFIKGYFEGRESEVIADQQTKFKVVTKSTGKKRNKKNFLHWLFEMLKAN